MINTDWDNFCDHSNNYVGEYWNKSPTPDGATPIILSLANRDVTGIDFTLDPAGTVSGHVYEADGSRQSLAA